MCRDGLPAHDGDVHHGGMGSDLLILGMTNVANSNSGHGVPPEFTGYIGKLGPPQKVDRSQPTNRTSSVRQSVIRSVRQPVNQF